MAIAKHKLNGMEVAIKCIESKKYARLTDENLISEADAMDALRSSPYIVNFVEKITMTG